MPDEAFAKILAGKLLPGVRDLAQWGLERGHITPAQLRLTVEARREQAAKLIESGMSQRKAAKELGVSKNTVRRDMVHNGPKTGPKRTTKAHKLPPTRPAPEITDPVKEINEFHRELVTFLDDFTRRFNAWRATGPLVDKDGKAAVMQALYLCADGFARLAQEFDDR